MANLERRTIVKELRESGWRAYEDGIPIEACPYRDMDAFQWKQGWRDAEQDHQYRLDDIEINL